METNKDEPLERAIAALDELLALTREAGSQSAMFLEMARLQLQLEFNGITEVEFGAFCDALEEGKFLRAGELPSVSHDRARHSGDLRLMSRAWREPQDRASLRGRARAGR